MKLLMKIIPVSRLAAAANGCCSRFYTESEEVTGTGNINPATTRDSNPLNDSLVGIDVVGVKVSTAEDGLFMRLPGTENSDQHRKFAAAVAVRIRNRVARRVDGWTWQRTMAATAVSVNIGRR